MKGPIVSWSMAIEDLKEAECLKTLLEHALESFDPLEAYEENIIKKQITQLSIMIEDMKNVKELE